MTIKKTILVTGATGSIGGAAAIALVKGGAKVVLLGRKLDKLKARTHRIHTELSEAGINFSKNDIETLVIDFADMNSVRGAAADAMNRFNEINGLILSVGAIIQKGPNILPNGHEAMFATNVMGPFLFTQLLIKRFEKSAGKLSSFGLSTFYDCKFKESRFSEISFSGSWWQACRFEQEDYFFVRFPSSVFIDTQFTKCRLQKAIFRAATFIRCTFESCNLADAVFHKARFIETRWIDTDINQAANLEEVRYD